MVGDSGAIVHDYGQRHQGVVESTRVPGQGAVKYRILRLHALHALDP